MRAATGDIFRGKARTTRGIARDIIQSCRRGTAIATSGGVAVVKSLLNIKVILGEGDSFGEADYLWQQSLHRHRLALVD